MSERSTFSPFWHRVRAMKPRLRPHVQVTRQHYRGRRWYVVHDPSSNQFYRLSTVAHEFLGLLDGHRTVEEVWQHSLTRHADDALTQNEVIQLLSQLFAGNLLTADVTPETEQLLTRGRERRGKRLQQQAIGLMYFKMRLLNPDRLLRALEPIFRPVLNTWGFALWAAWVLAGLVALLPHLSSLLRGVDEAVAPSNWGWMFAVFIALKLWHELGHGLICRRFGGQVPEFGVMLLVLIPSPYVDASSAWTFASKWQRMAVGAGGMIFELAVASAAAFVYLGTPEGSLLHQIAYNAIFTASVSTILFNANPLMRFDGYYILSDYLEVPNLGQRANNMLRFLVQRHVFRMKDANAPTSSPGEALILLVYGVAAMAYRLFLFFSITLYIMGKMFAVGLFLALWTAGMWFILPVGGFIHWLATNPQIAERRGRVILTSLGLAAAVALAVGVIPAPDRRRAVGVVESTAQTSVFAGADGFVRTTHVRPGQRVAKGDPIVTMESDELLAQIRYSKAQLDEAVSRLNQAAGRNVAATQVADEYVQTLRAHLAVLEDRRAGLVVRSPHDGIVVSADPQRLVGAFLRRGEPVCDVLDDTSLRIAAVLTQSEASWIKSEPFEVEMRLSSNVHRVVPCVTDRVIEVGTRELPHESLGFAGGGKIEVDKEDRSGRLSRRPVFKAYFFAVQPGGTAGPGRIDDGVGLAGERVTLRFELRPKPLMTQWIDSLRKTLQGRARV